MLKAHQARLPLQAVAWIGSSVVRRTPRSRRTSSSRAATPSVASTRRTLRALAVGRPTRLPQLPDVPTLAEAGFADIDPRTWFGVFAGERDAKCCPC